jgi:hypothetical protein
VIEHSYPLSYHPLRVSFLVSSAAQEKQPTNYITFAAQNNVRKVSLKKCFECSVRLQLHYRDPLSTVALPH